MAATRSPSSASDVLRYLEMELQAARVQAAMAVDRAQALAELWSLASQFAERLGVQVLYPDDLHATAASEEERARLNALISRAIPVPRRNGA